MSHASALQQSRQATPAYLGKRRRWEGSVYCMSAACVLYIHVIKAVGKFSISFQYLATNSSSTSQNTFTFYF